MKSSTLLVMLLLPVFHTSSSRAAESSKNSPGASLSARFSADDFDWRDILPYLFVASTMAGDQGVQEVLENSRVLRLHVANEIRAECAPDKGRCAAKRDGFTLEGEINKRIDEIVREGIVHRHKTVTVDYPLGGQPFPFSEIAALKSEKRPDVYFILQLADHSYTAAQVEAKYGAPYDTNIFQWYSVFTYRLDSQSYTSRAVFEIDPTDGAVIKVAISLKPKKSKNHD